MAVNLKSTRTTTRDGGVKLLVYGQAGAGKTTLIRTLPDPIILSAEGGLLSLQDSDIPYIEVATLADLGAAYKWLKEDGEAAKYRSVALDSISEIAEVVLVEEKNTSKDGRMAYGAMNDRVTQLIRAFRDLPGRHIYFSAKMEKAQTEEGTLLYAPSMPGQKLSQNLPYFFDEVLALRIVKGEEGEPRRALQCHGDVAWQAKDRSGRLDTWEPADLSAVIAKIEGRRADEK